MPKNKAIKRRIHRTRPTHKKILLHPVAVFIFLCIGVVLTGLSVGTLAEDVVVSAKVSAPFIEKPAVIQIVAPVGEPQLQKQVERATTPQTAILTNVKQITLSGECPKGSHLEFYRNNAFAGATTCVGDPTFSITLDLVPGLNAINALVYNITNDTGPVSAPVYINYTPSNQKPFFNAHELILSSSFKSLGFLVGHNANWDVTIQGGTPPYSLNVNWGDGSTSAYEQLSGGLNNITHTYQKASDSVGYQIAITAKDAQGQNAILDLMTIISNPATSQAQKVALANSNLNPGLIDQVKKWLIAAWPLYIIVLLMLISFWLGEREEYHKLVKKLRRRKRR